MSALHVAPGERLLINGPSGSGKSCLLRAIAGIWPLGEGGVRLPPDARVIALPQRRYFPLGTLRQVMTYPTPAESVAEADIQAAMIAAGIGHLAAKLDEEAEWSTVLSGGEQQRIGFARVLIHRPDVVLLDEAASALEEAEARELYRMLSERLPSADHRIDRPLGGARRPAPTHLRNESPPAPVRIRRAEPRWLAPLIGRAKRRKIRLGREPMLKMNFWNAKWDLDIARCPCDAHFNDWVKQKKLRNKLIYHFGTGNHHVVGLKQATNKSNNAVFAITASKEEYASYIELAINRPSLEELSRLFWRHLPHQSRNCCRTSTSSRCSISANSSMTNKAYGGVDDAKLLDMLTAKTRLGGHILFFTGSFAFPSADKIIAKWEKNGRVKRVGAFKTLLVFRKLK